MTEELKQTLNQNTNYYSEEGTAFADIENQLINRLKAGYYLDSIERNRKLSQHFRGCHDQYSNINQMIHSQLRGQKALWSWLNNIQTNETQYNDFLDGIVKQLDMEIINESVRDPKQIQLSYKKGTPNINNSEEILGFRLYTSESRQRVMRF